jgi:hypothetical protein
MWTEVVVIVGSPERVSNHGQPFKVKLPQFFCGVGVVARQRAREASTGRSGIRNVELNGGALKDGTMEEMSCLVCGRMRVAEDVCGPSRFAEKGDV